MAARKSERIKLWGIVQGVGFRPFVAKAAQRLHMKGEVCNTGGLVEITLTDTPDRISQFIDYLNTNKPAPAEIVHIKREPVSYREFQEFTILKSSTGGEEAIMIPPDLAICPHCLSELYETKNPRHQHPFISCMICGPRYTIIDRVPYDRENTSMADFPMCEFCEQEYTDLADRRHHAQTISCHDCGPQLLWKDAVSGNSKETGACGEERASIQTAAPSEADAMLLDHAADILSKGGVIAFKSVGGYNLVASPFQEEAVSKLRQLKGRKEKPFAVMFRDLAQIEEFCHVNDVEARLLESAARPIVLLERKERLSQSLLQPEPPLQRASGDKQYRTMHTDSFQELEKSRFIGSFLPSFAAQYLLLDRISPLIFTSANYSDLPMIKDEAEMLAFAETSPELDGILYNLRQIRVRVDDSVVRVIDGQPQMIRRSKGYAPLPLHIAATSEADLTAAKNTQSAADTDPEANVHKPLAILAAGSQLKNSFALSKGDFVYMSQYFGDLDTVENQMIYAENITRLQALFRIAPELVVCDLHPLYHTTQFAKEYAAAHQLPLLQVQHHHAHIASVMAEHQLTGSVIGISFDGTGYGTDGCIWGGEVLICERETFERFSHLRYVDMIGGDRSVKDAAHSALSYIHACAHSDYHSECGGQFHVDLAEILAYGKKTILQRPDAGLVQKALQNRINVVRSSSMGRLFDAVSALLGICDDNAYEGQCAILLEDAAAYAQKHPGEKQHCDLALAFHQQIIDLILTQCRHAREIYHTNQVALTGGTFQNRILMEGTLKKLRAEGFEPYYNISVSPNDGGIALGQAYLAAQWQNAEKNNRNGAFTNDETIKS